MISFLLLVVVILIATIIYFAWKLNQPQISSSEDIKPVSTKTVNYQDQEKLQPAIAKARPENNSYEDFYAGPQEVQGQHSSGQKKEDAFYRISDATLMTHRSLSSDTRVKLSEEQVELILRLQAGYDQLPSSKVNGNHQDKVNKILRTLQHSQVNAIERNEIEEVLKAERYYLDSLLN